MIKEDLFLAIGEVESSRLLRSENLVQVSSDLRWEDANMTNKHVKTGRIVRNLLIAAVLVSMLAVTAYAVGGYLIFDTPEKMVAAIFGDQTGFDHSNGVPQYFEDGQLALVTPTFDRVPADETIVAEDVAPHISPVGQSIAMSGYTLRVDAFLYDDATKCGLLTYTLENPDGLPEYKLQPNGEVWFPGGELVNANQYGYSYIIQEKTTDTCLAATLYFQLDSRRGETLDITFTQWAWGLREKMGQLREEIQKTVSEAEAVSYLQEKVGAEIFAQIEEVSTQEELVAEAYNILVEEQLAEWENTMEPEIISISCGAEGGLTHVTLGGGNVIVTPICFQIDLTELEFLHEDRIHGDNVDTVVIRYADGTKYVVHEDATMNYLFGHISASDQVAGENYHVLTYLFNRVINIEEVAAVIVNGTELPVD